MARKPSKAAATGAPAGDGGTSAAGNVDGAVTQSGQAGNVQDSAGTTPNTPPAPAPPVAVGTMVPARILRDCWLGAAGEVIELEASSAKAVEASGAVDLHPRALVGQASGSDGQGDPVIEDDED